MLRVAALGLLVAALVAGGAASATSVDARMTLERLGGAPVTGKQFRVIATVENTDPVGPPHDFTVTVKLATGLRLVKVSQMFNAPDCSQSGQTLTCHGHSIGGQEGSQSYRLDLKTGTPATYSISASVKVDSAEDRNPTNDAASLDVVVTAAPVVATGLVLVPAKPVAGRALRATLLLKRAGAPVRAGRVVCAAKVGGTSLKGKGAPTAKGGACTWTLARSAKGKRITGSVSATVGTTKLAKAFSKIVS